MITGKDKLVKITFYYKPKENEFNDDIRQMVYDTFDPFRLYCLELKDTTMEQEQNKKKD